MENAVVITGADGGIGSALVSAFASKGWYVIGTDTSQRSPVKAHAFLPADLLDVVSSEAALAAFCASVEIASGARPIKALINNAALQILGRAGEVSLSDWEKSLKVNVTAPFALSRGLLPRLEAASGVVLNIGSVHAQATKAGFVSYAASKAALHGLTRSLAVDLGSRLRVICLAPAAVATSMLRAGFEDDPQGFEALALAHPAGRIADPREIALAAAALCGDDFRFATGSTFWLDGGVLSRLHDPA